MVTILQHLLASDPAPAAIESFAGFWSAFEAQQAAFERPVEVALASGFAADRVGWAFAGGYQAAIAQMFGARGPAAFCATEAGGAHPRQIGTRLERDGSRFRLRGEKRMVTLGPAARLLYVVATRGARAPDEQDLVVVRVPSERPGVSVAALPALPFVPEIAHGKLVIDAPVEEAEVLPGDGYADYLKPFRTVEDIHVSAAMTGFFIALGRRFGAPASQLEALAAHALTLRALAREPSDDPAVHVALAGAFAQLAAMIAAFDLERLDPTTRSGWERDRALFGVAASARERRLARAWERLSQG